MPLECGGCVKEVVANQWSLDGMLPESGWPGSFDSRDSARTILETVTEVVSMTVIALARFSALTNS
jgi:hypothetical protein